MVPGKRVNPNLEKGWQKVVAEKFGMKILSH